MPGTLQGFNTICSFSKNLFSRGLEFICVTSKTHSSLHGGLNHIWKGKPLSPWEGRTERLSSGWVMRGSLSENMVLKLRKSWPGEKWRKMKASRDGHVAPGSEAGKSVRFQ